MTKKKPVKRAKPPKTKSRNTQSGGVAVIAGLAALGLGAGIAVERLLIGRSRTKQDRFGEEKYGEFIGDRSFEVTSFDGARLIVQQMGPDESKQGTIFLHGLALDHRIWHHQMLGLDGGYRHLFYDARNHGRSRGGHHSPVEIATLTDDLLHVVEASGLEQIVLVGHSLGGMTVLEYCRRFPDEMGKRIKGIVLVNTTYTDATKTLVASSLIGPLERRSRKLIDGIFQDPRTSRVMRLRGDDLSYLMVRLFGFGSGSSPAQIEFVGRLLSAFHPKHLIELLKALREWDMTDSLEAIEVPTLVIAGGSDRMTTVRASQHINDRIPDSSLVIFDGVGHCSMLERGEDFNVQLSNFIGRVNPLTAGERNSGRR